MDKRYFSSWDDQDGSPREAAKMFYTTSSTQRKRHRYSTALQYMSCPRPPIHPINSTVLSILDTTDILRLEAKVAGNVQDSALVVYHDNNNRLMSPILRRRLSQSVTPQSSARIVRPRGFASLFERISEDSPVMGQSGRSNPARRAHPKSGRVCYLAALTVLAVVTYYLVSPEDRDLGQYWRGEPLTTWKKKRRDGLDNEYHNHIFHRYDSIKTGTVRYVVFASLGAGSYGQVLRCQDIASRKIVAIKVMKYFERDGNNVWQREQSILNRLNTGESEGQHHVIHLKGAFEFHGHGCLVFDVAGPNLYTLLGETMYTGFYLEDVRQYTKQLLIALHYMHSNEWVHADVKPDNALTHSENPEQLWLIDFGLSMQSQELRRDDGTTSMQTRYYRAPETILGCLKTSAIDIWSLGCTSAELLLGKPLFPFNNEYDHLELVEGLIGPIPSNLLRAGIRTKVFYSPDYHTGQFVRRKRRDSIRLARESGRTASPKRAENLLTGRTIAELIHGKRRLETEDGQGRKLRYYFVDFLQRVLELDPAQRLTARQALQHPFITLKLKGLLRDWDPEESSSPRQHPTTRRDLQAPLDTHLGVPPPRPRTLSEVDDYPEDDDDDDSLYTATATTSLTRQGGEARHPLANPARTNIARQPLPYPDNDGAHLPPLHTRGRQAGMGSETVSQSDDTPRRNRVRETQGFPAYNVNAFPPNEHPYIPPEQTLRVRNAEYDDPRYQQPTQQRQHRQRQPPPPNQTAGTRFPAHYGVVYPPPRVTPYYPREQQQPQQDQRYQRDNQPPRRRPRQE